MYVDSVSGYSAPLPIGNLKLFTSDDWVKWYDMLQLNARSLGLLDAINAAKDDQPTDVLEAPPTPTIQMAAEIPGDKSLLEKFAVLDRVYQYEAQSYYRRKDKEQKLIQWITNTVKSSILKVMYRKLDEDKKEATLRRIMRTLKESLAPSEHILRGNARDQYNLVLRRAYKANQNPGKWYVDWLEAYSEAKTYGIPEIQGISAIQTFLHAVGARFEPTWAKMKLNALLDLGVLGTEYDESLSLETCTVLFRDRVCDRRKPETKA